MSKSNKSTKAHNQYVYAYVFNGGVLKQNHCVVSVSNEHPETTVFNELKRYYGNDIKGAYYRCTKSLNEVQEGINFKLKNFSLGEILFNNNFTETKKILLDITGLKQCSGTINTFTKKDDLEGDEPNDKTQKTKKVEESDEESEPEENTKKSKSKTQKSDKKKSDKKGGKAEKKIVSKSKVENSEDEDSEHELEPETIKKNDKTKKSEQKSKCKENKKSSQKTELQIDSDSDSDDEVQPKNNNTSIELSDDSDEEDDAN